MGFQKGTFCSVWEVKESKSGKYTDVKLSHSQKDKTTGEYKTDFSAYVAFIGAAHNKAKKLNVKDRIVIENCDVEAVWDKEAGKMNVRFKVFDFNMADGSSGSGGENSGGNKSSYSSAAKKYEGDASDDLPF